MEDVIRAYKCRDPEERIPVLRLELDYELALLYEAMRSQNYIQKQKCLQRLWELRRELLMLEEL
ncbi:hypothetical protein [Seinonella peptonophila]|nr:hypothetical protein [Seinonella peptonophila]